MYLEMYDMEPNDLVIWRIVQSKLVKHPLHLKTVLMAHRIMTQLQLGSDDALERISWALECIGPEQVFVLFFL